MAIITRRSRRTAHSLLAMASSTWQLPRTRSSRGSARRSALPIWQAMPGSRATRCARPRGPSWLGRSNGASGKTRGSTGSNASRSSAFPPVRSLASTRRLPARSRRSARWRWRSSILDPVGSRRLAPPGRSTEHRARSASRRRCSVSTRPRCSGSGWISTRAGSMSDNPPLTGIRVVEVGNYMAAPFCTMQLADLGAEVIKVEHPEGGDQVRHSAPLVEGEGSAFMRLNRNKRSVALDLKTERGKEIFRKLAGSADVVVENLRPGTMKDLGLEYDHLRRINPALIYVAASGWGQDGPLRDQPGMDIMAQARSGLMSITGTPGGEPVKVGVPVCDLACALSGAVAAVAALYERRDTG